MKNLSCNDNAEKCRHARRWEGEERRTHSLWCSPLWILYFHGFRSSRCIGVSSPVLASRVIAYPRATGCDVSFLPVCFQLERESRQKYMAGTKRSKGKDFYIVPIAFHQSSTRIFLHRDWDYLVQNLEGGTWGIMNPKTHKIVFIKSIWATGRPGSFMEMRLPVKQCLKAPGTMGSAFTILSGRQKRSAGSRCLWLGHLPCAGSAAGPAQQGISPWSGWPREAISAWLSVYTAGALAAFLNFFCLFVWGGVFWFLWVLWQHHPK